LPKYNDLLVESLRYFAVLPRPVSFEAFAKGFSWDLGHDSWYWKPKVPGLPDGILRSFVLSQYQCVTDRQTDRPTDTPPIATSRCRNFVKMFDADKNRMIGLPYGEKTVTIC